MSARDGQWVRRRGGTAITDEMECRDAPAPCADTPVARKTAASSSRSRAKSRNASPPRARSSPPGMPRVPCDTAPRRESSCPPRRRKGPHWQSLAPPRRDLPSAFVVYSCTAVSTGRVANLHHVERSVDTNLFMALSSTAPPGLRKRERHRTATRAEKGRILDEFVTVAKCHPHLGHRELRVARRLHSDRHVGRPTMEWSFEATVSGERQPVSRWAKANRARLRG